MPSKLPIRGEPRRISDLSQAQKRLLALCQSINYGRLRKLQVRGGQPVFEPPPRVVRERKFGAQQRGRTDAEGDYYLKPELVEFLDCLQEIGDGEIFEVEVHHGLPFRAIFKEEAG
jgi:hypothetical protein